METNNNIRFFSVSDRFTLRYRVAQQWIRSLAEKQTLIKFYDLSHGIKRNDNLYICHPLLAGRILASQSKLALDTVPFGSLTHKQKRVLLPYLTNYVEIIGKDSNLRYVGRACNLRKLPEQKILAEKATINLFPFYTYHCSSYIPVQVLRFESPCREERKLSLMAQWFASIPLDKEQAKEVAIDLKKSEMKNEVVPFQLIIYKINLSLAARKICPHVALPYHLYQGLGNTSYQDSNESTQAQMFLTTEYPDIALGNYAVLEAEIAQDEIRYARWMMNERKNLGQILTPVFVIAYTLYILSLLGIYEKPFTGDDKGRPWVENNIRAHKIHSNGYWTYILPPHKPINKSDKSYGEMIKFIPNYGVFWLLCDFSQFMSPSERASKETTKDINVQGRGILYYVVQSLMDQVSTWERRNRRSTTSQQETTTTTLGSLELEIEELSLHKNVRTDEILHRLDHLRVKLSRPFFFSDPGSYRSVLEEIIFLSWNIRPGGLSLAKSQLKQQMGLTLRDFERNCLLQSDINLKSSSSPFLENLELDVFGWSRANPLVLPHLLDFFQESAYPLEYPIQMGFQDDSMAELFKDAQHKASGLEDTEKFWEVIRKSSHLYLRDSYDTLRLRPGEESWNPTIPRTGEIQTEDNCIRFGYTTLSQHESQDWYGFIERELISRTFQIDTRNVSMEGRALAEKISQATARYGLDFLAKLKSRIATLKSSSSQDDRLFPLDLHEVEKELNLLIEEENKLAATVQYKLPPDFVELQKKYTKEDIEPTSLVNLAVYVEQLEEIFPDLISLISLLPDVYRNKILAPNEDTTLQDKKKELQDRVLQLQKYLRAAELDQLVEDYPVPPGRKPLRTSAEKIKQAEEIKARMQPLPVPEPLVLVPTAALPTSEIVPQSLPVEDFPINPMSANPLTQSDIFQPTTDAPPAPLKLSSFILPDTETTKEKEEPIFTPSTPPETLVIPSLKPLSLTDIPARDSEI